MKDLDFVGTKNVDQGSWRAERSLQNTVVLGVLVWINCELIYFLTLLKMKLQPM